jgi:hypothetical protein
MISSIYHSNARLREVYHSHKDRRDLLINPDAPRPKPQLMFNETSKRWELFSVYEDRHIAKKAGFFWDAKSRCWATGDFRRAVKLIRFATGPTKRGLLHLVS